VLCSFIPTAQRIILLWRAQWTWGWVEHCDVPDAEGRAKAAANGDDRQHDVNFRQGKGLVTPTEAIASIKESCRRIGEKTSEMTDEQYAVWKEQIEELEETLTAILREAERE
jgi:hypothetical protein